jgi:positive regulator of sigma E activity
MKEKGIVIELSGQMARVKILPTEACKSCPSSSLCGVADKKMILEADNKLKAVLHDEVWVETSAKQSMIAVFFLFMLPVLLGLLAVFFTARYKGWYMVASGFIGFAMGLLIAKAIDRYLRGKGLLLPRIVEVVKSKNT